MTNCSERQKTVWRKHFKDSLRHDFKCLDPTEPNARKGALAVSTDIEEADIVIANMWRESIGTTLGIVHAKRMGIPVILIDPNYLDSPILKSVVGDSIVHSEDAALKKLRDEVAPNLTRDVQVVKSDCTVEPFEVKKLQTSLKSVCVAAGIDDPIFHILLSRRVHRAIVTTSDSSSIKTEVIRNTVLQELENISHDSLGDGGSKESEYAEALLEKWEFHEGLVKEEARKTEAKELELEELSGIVNSLEWEVEILRAQLSEREPTSTSTRAAEAVRSALLSSIHDKLGNKRALCIAREGGTTFASVFSRCGVSKADFDALFEEKALEGKQSNLNHDLKGYVKNYPIVLYAFNGLRHLSESLRQNENLIVGAGPNAAVRRFLKSCAN